MHTQTRNEPDRMRIIMHGFVKKRCFTSLSSTEHNTENILLPVQKELFPRLTHIDLQKNKDLAKH